MGQKPTPEAEYRERFVATLTHDLRSPLAAALMGAHMIAQSPDDPEQVRDWANRIAESVERMDRLISDILDVSRLDAGNALALRLERCDLHAIAAELSREMAARHGARFRVEADGDTSGVWSSDCVRRILENLLTNAVKYGDRKGSITVRIRRRDDRVLLSVHNEGAAITQEEQARLFEALTPASSHPQRPGKQRWGLALVRGLVEAHGGVVNVASQAAEGTTFTVELPAETRAR